MPRFSFSSRFSWLTVIAALLAFSFGPLSRTEAQTPSADQIEMFQNMSPEQQQAIMEAMGGGTSSSPLPRSGVTSDRRLEIRQYVRKAPEVEEQERRGQQAQTIQPAIPGRQTRVPQQGTDQGGAANQTEPPQELLERADGSVVTCSGNAWFSGGGVDIKSGDTIVAPLDTERMRPLSFWTSVTTIIYNLGLGAAAVASF